MANYVNKFVWFGTTKFDISADTVTADKLALGVTAHDKSGAPITGTSTKDSDTSGATVAVGEMLEGKTAYARGSLLTGTMPNVGKQTSTISTKNQSVSISAGYHDGSGTVAISTTEKNKIIAGNIKNGVTILGVTGNYSGDSVERPQSDKVVTPSNEQQVVTPDTGYTCLSQVTVNSIPYSEQSNSAGGITITIG